MGDEITKSPHIRFAGFTDDWEQRKLGDVSERVRGNDGRMDLPTLTISAGSGWLDQRERFSGNIAGKEQKNSTLLSKGELSNNQGNSKLAKYAAVFELRTYEEALVPRVYHSFKVTNESSSDFIEYMFATKIPDRELGKLISSGARMDGLLNINYDEFMSIKITLPKVKEQIKIAKILRNLDNIITLHQRKLELLKVTKKSMLQKMFPKDGESVPEIRFAGFTDAWEQRKLIDVAKYRNGKAHENSICENGSYVVVNSKFVSTDGEVRKYSNEQIEPLMKNEIAFVLSDVPNGRAIARTFLVQEDDKYTLNQRIAGITPNENTNPYFLHISINRHPYFLRFDDGVKQTNLSKSDVENFETFYPKRLEQEKIGTFFSDFDNLITLHQRELDLLKDLKKSMLQQMFI